jgi:hypothetical protein
VDQAGGGFGDQAGLKRLGIAREFFSSSPDFLNDVGAFCCLVPPMDSAP